MLVIIKVEVSIVGNINVLVSGTGNKMVLVIKKVFTIDTRSW